MRLLIMFALLPLLSVQAVVRQTDIDIDAGSLTERACYFEGKRYSEGASVQDAGETIRCGVLDGITENGALGWVREGGGLDAVIEQRQDDSSRVIELRK
ncbi:hypothetical protein D3C84_768680 [compost metagenome]